MLVEMICNLILGKFPSFSNIEIGMNIDFCHSRKIYVVIIRFMEDYLHT